MSSLVSPLADLAKLTESDKLSSASAHKTSLASSSLIDTAGHESVTLAADSFIATATPSISGYTYSPPLPDCDVVHDCVRIRF